MADASWGNKARSIVNRQLFFLILRINKVHPNYHLIFFSLHLLLFFQLLSLDIIEFSQETLNGYWASIILAQIDTDLIIIIRVTVAKDVLFVFSRGLEYLTITYNRSFASTNTKVNLIVLGRGLAVCLDELENFDSGSHFVILKLAHIICVIVDLIVVVITSGVVHNIAI